MQEALREESQKLARSWMQHDEAHLRDYLVADVEDPRLNLQSIFSRHFLIHALGGQSFGALMEEEYRFAGVMNWLLGWLRQIGDPEEVELVAHALRCGADNAEGIAIPRFVLQAFSVLPMRVADLEVPNYISSFLAGAALAHVKPVLDSLGADSFQQLWNQLLRNHPGGNASSQLPATVLEPACGSANDYRFLASYGIARWLDYTGIDLCPKNVQNAHALFPDVRFKLGNVFEIDAPAKAFDWLFVHDLFEHLSPAGLDVAVAEVCRVTSRGLCLGFFNMDEVPEHIVQPFEDYHWSVLSMARMKEQFASYGFATQVLHAGSFLRQRVGCDFTHNPNAYTFLLRPV